MKILIIILAVLFSGCASFDRGDYARQTAYTALHIADWSQTKLIVHPDRTGEEKNFILGENASQKEVDQYFAVTLLLHYIAVGLLEEDKRKWFQWGTIFVQSAAVGNNLHRGWEIEF